MLYKLAASKSKLDRRARENVDIHTVGGLLGGPVGSGVAGYVRGKEAHHPVVGFLFGPSGVNGAVAKDTGHSTFGTTAQRGMRNHAILGGIGGTLVGGAVGGLPGAAIGGTIGAAGGAASGLVGHSAAYGLGHFFGEKRHVRTKRRRRK